MNPIYIVTYSFGGMCRQASVVNADQEHTDEEVENIVRMHFKMAPNEFGPGVLEPIGFEVTRLGHDLVQDIDLHD